MNIEKYLMEDERTYNVGRILKDAGVRMVNAARLEEYHRGDIEIAPDYKELMDEAERRNASLSPVNPPAFADMRKSFASEWDIRGSKDGE